MTSVFILSTFNPSEKNLNFELIFLTPPPLLPMTPKLIESRELSSIFFTIPSEIIAPTAGRIELLVPLIEAAVGLMLPPAYVEPGGPVRAGGGPEPPETERRRERPRGKLP